MMINFTPYYLWPIGLFAAAILCILFLKWFPRRKNVLSFLTALFSIIGMIVAFIMGATMEELIIPFLVILWLSLHSDSSMEGEEQ